MIKSLQRFLERLGPGLITGAADDDPSGIATYSQGGAAFGTGLLWTLVFTFPLMVGIQVISARLGRVTGKGIAGIMREAGLEDVRWEPLTLGIVTLHVGRRPV